MIRNLIRLPIAPQGRYNKMLLLPLSAILNFSNLDHIWNEHPSFLNLLGVLYKDQKKKLGPYICTQDPPQLPDYHTLKNAYRSSLDIIYGKTHPDYLFSLIKKYLTVHCLINYLI